jgi:hypothetical protein
LPHLQGPLLLCTVTKRRLQSSAVKLAKTYHAEPVLLLYAELPVFNALPDRFQKCLSDDWKRSRLCHAQVGVPVGALLFEGVAKPLGGYLHGFSNLVRRLSLTSGLRQRSGPTLLARRPRLSV